MQTLKTKLALLTDRPTLIKKLQHQEPLHISADQWTQNDYEADILLVDAETILNPNNIHLVTYVTQHKFQKKIMLISQNDNSSESVFDTKLMHWHIDQYIYLHEFTDEVLNSSWEQIQQIQQDIAYLNLSTELNEQYEVIKTDLLQKMQEKSKHIVESRKQIYEINNRVEVLRKLLYTTTEVKSLVEAESELSDLLIKYGMVTWFKIVRESQKIQFETDLKSQMESTIYISEIKIGREIYFLFFFKGDKRSFRKSDVNYFKKLTEALLINLNRYNNLLALKHSERMFDLAFHSSHHAIIVIDQNYQVYQANLAAENSSTHHDDNIKCYQLLFNLQKPCAGCQLGRRFEIQKDNRTYTVQSNRFSHSDETLGQYWIHLYADISEQKTLENKYQQTAKLSEVGLITSSIAHELNNPLGGILSYLQIMKMELPANHQFQQDLQHLIEAALRIKVNIEDLLFFSRKEDQSKIEKIELIEIFSKTLDLLQMQLKKEHLVVSFQTTQIACYQQASVLHFRNIVHLIFQFLIYKLKTKKQLKPNMSGLVEVKITQDHAASYMTFNTNLGPYDIKQTSHDLSLITLEKSLLDQAFQMVISDPQPGWMQLQIKMPLQ